MNTPRLAGGMFQDFLHGVGFGPLDEYEWEGDVVGTHLAQGELPNRVLDTPGDGVMGHGCNGAVRGVRFPDPDNEAPFDAPTLETASSNLALPFQPCLACGYEMVAIKGSRLAVCPRCGFKDSCC